MGFKFYKLNISLLLAGDNNNKGEYISFFHVVKNVVKACINYQVVPDKTKQVVRDLKGFQIKKFFYLKRNVFPRLLKIK